MEKLPEKQGNPPTNTRRERRQAERKYLLLVLFGLVVVGGGLIALIFGPEALLTALPCLLGGVVLIVSPWLLLTALEKWRERADAAAWAAARDEASAEREAGP